MSGALVSRPMAGCRVDPIPDLPSYSPQVSKGSAVGRIKSACCVVSSIKLLKLTTKRDVLFKTSFTPLPGGMV